MTLIFPSKRAQVRSNWTRNGGDVFGEVGGSGWEWEKMVINVSARVLYGWLTCLIGYASCRDLLEYLHKMADHGIMQTLPLGLKHNCGIRKHKVSAFASKLKFDRVVARKGRVKITGCFLLAPSTILKTLASTGCPSTKIVTVILPSGALCERTPNQTLPSYGLTGGRFSSRYRASKITLIDAHESWIQFKIRSPPIIIF